MSEAEFEEFTYLYNEIELLMDADRQRLPRTARKWYTVDDALCIYRRMLDLAKCEVPHA